MPRDPTTWMWAQACEMLEQAERLHRRFFQLHRLTGSRPVWEPPVDVTETHDQFKIIVILPGVPPENIDVTRIDDVLVVSGNKPLDFEPDTTVIHRLEIPYGRFERHIRLPTGRFRIGTPVVANGCLTIPLYKTG